MGMIPLITEKQVDDKMNYLGENYFKQTNSLLYLKKYHNQIKFRLTHTLN